MTKRWLLTAAALAAAAAFAVLWFRPVNRVQRATYRLLAVCPKDAPGADSPLDLVKVLAPFQRHLAPDVAVSVPEICTVRGRAEALQALQFVRQASDVIWLDHATVRAVPRDAASILVSVEVPFKMRLSRPYRSLAGGRRWDWTLHARLHWTRTPDGWLVTRAELAPFRGTVLPELDGPP